MDCNFCGEIVEWSPSKSFGRFTKKIGEGATKTVYEAIDMKEGKLVAWNEVNTACLSPDERERVNAEVALLQQVKHEHIIDFAASWTTPTSIVFITAIIESGDLQRFYRTHTVKLKVIKKWCRQILSGLAYLHSFVPPIIHRDIKCENVLYSAADGTVRIGDLGLSTRVLEGSPCAALGTPSYMAPELYEGRYTETVDIYSFGMCVLEMVTRRLPYDECSNSAQIYRKVTQGILPESFHSIRYPSIQAFIQYCLSPGVRGERPSALEVLAHPFLEEGTHVEEDEATDLLWPEEAPANDSSAQQQQLQSRSSNNSQRASTAESGYSNQSSLEHEAAHSGNNGVVGAHHYPDPDSRFSEEGQLTATTSDDDAVTTGRPPGIPLALSRHGYPDGTASTGELESVLHDQQALQGGVHVDAGVRHLRIPGSPLGPGPSEGAHAPSFPGRSGEITNGNGVPNGGGGHAVRGHHGHALTTGAELLDARELPGGTYQPRHAQPQHALGAEGGSELPQPEEGGGGWGYFAGNGGGGAAGGEPPRNPPPNHAAKQRQLQPLATGDGTSPVGDDSDLPAYFRAHAGGGAEAVGGSPEGGDTASVDDEDIDALMEGWEAAPRIRRPSVAEAGAEGPGGEGAEEGRGDAGAPGSHDQQQQQQRSPAPRGVGDGDDAPLSATASGGIHGGSALSGHEAPLRQEDGHEAPSPQHPRELGAAADEEDWDVHLPAAAASGSSMDGAAFAASHSYDFEAGLAGAASSSSSGDTFLRPRGRDSGGHTAGGATATSFSSFADAFAHSGLDVRDSRASFGGEDAVFSAAPPPSPPMPAAAAAGGEAGARYSEQLSAGPSRRSSPYHHQHQQPDHHAGQGEPDGGAAPGSYEGGSGALYHQPMEDWSHHQQHGHGHPVPHSTATSRSSFDAYAPAHAAAEEEGGGAGGSAAASAPAERTGFPGAQHPSSAHGEGPTSPPSAPGEPPAPDREFGYTSSPAPMLDTSIGSSFSAPRRSAGGDSTPSDSPQHQPSQARHSEQHRRRHRHHLHRGEGEPDPHLQQHQQMGDSFHSSGGDSGDVASPMEGGAQGHAAALQQLLLNSSVRTDDSAGSGAPGDSLLLHNSLVFHEPSGSTQSVASPMPSVEGDAAHVPPAQLHHQQPSVNSGDDDEDEEGAGGRGEEDGGLGGSVRGSRQQTRDFMQHLADAEGRVNSGDLPPAPQDQSPLDEATPLSLATTPRAFVGETPIYSSDLAAPPFGSHPSAGAPSAATTPYFSAQSSPRSEGGRGERAKHFASTQQRGGGPAPGEAQSEQQLNRGSNGDFSQQLEEVRSHAGSDPWGGLGDPYSSPRSQAPGGDAAHPTGSHGGPTSQGPTLRSSGDHRGSAQSSRSFMAAVSPPRSLFPHHEEAGDGGEQDPGVYPSYPSGPDHPSSSHGHRRHDRHHHHPLVLEGEGDDSSAGQQLQQQHSLHHPSVDHGGGSGSMLDGEELELGGAIFDASQPLPQSSSNIIDAEQGLLHPSSGGESGDHGHIIHALLRRNGMGDAEEEAQGGSRPLLRYEDAAQQHREQGASWDAPPGSGAAVAQQPHLPSSSVTRSSSDASIDYEAREGHSRASSSGGRAVSISELMSLPLLREEEHGGAALGSQLAGDAAAAQSSRSGESGATVLTTRQRIPGLSQSSIASTGSATLPGGISAAGGPSSAAAGGAGVLLTLAIEHDPREDGEVTRACMTFEFDKSNDNVAQMARAIVASLQELPSISIDDSCSAMLAAFLATQRFEPAVTLVTGPIPRFNWRSLRLGPIQAAAREGEEPLSQPASQRAAPAAVLAAARSPSTSLGGARGGGPEGQQAGGAPGPQGTGLSPRSGSGSSSDSTRPTQPPPAALGGHDDATQQPPPHDTTQGAPAQKGQAYAAEDYVGVASGGPSHRRHHTEDEDASSSGSGPGRHQRPLSDVSGMDPLSLLTHRSTASAGSAEAFLVREDGGDDEAAVRDSDGGGVSSSSSSSRRGSSSSGGLPLGTSRTMTMGDGGMLFSPALGPMNAPMMLNAQGSPTASGMGMQEGGSRRSMELDSGLVSGYLRGNALGGGAELAMPPLSLDAGDDGDGRRSMVRSASLGEDSREDDAVLRRFSNLSERFAGPGHELHEPPSGSRGRDGVLGSDGASAEPARHSRSPRTYPAEAEGRREGEEAGAAVASAPDHGAAVASAPDHGAAVASAPDHGAAVASAPDHVSLPPLQHPAEEGFAERMARSIKEQGSTPPGFELTSTPASSSSGGPGHPHPPIVRDFSTGSSTAAEAISSSASPSSNHAQFLTPPYPAGYYPGAALVRGFSHGSSLLSPSENGVPLGSGVSVVSSVTGSRDSDSIVGSDPSVGRASVAQEPQ